MRMSLPPFHEQPLWLVRPGTLVDVGVNIGYHFNKFITFPDSRVVGYEPQCALYNNLCKNLNQTFGIQWTDQIDVYNVALKNSIGIQWPDHIELYNVALSNFVGRTQIRVPIVGGDLAHPGGSITKEFTATETTDGRSIELMTHWVQVTTLDSQNLENVTYLKIDAEGAEEEILRGGAEMIARWKPPIDLELEEVHRAGSTTDVPAFLATLGYEGYFIYEENLMNMTDFNPALHQVCESDGVGAHNRQGYYVFDFMFIHKDDAWAHDRLKEIYQKSSAA